MNTGNTILIILAALQVAESVAVTRLTQETPCLSGQSCRLKCSVVAGVNDNGLRFYSNFTFVVDCPQGRNSCRSNFSPDFLRLTQEDYNTSYVDIVTFDPSNDATTWSCSDGSNGPRSNLSVLHNVLPSGSLTWGSTCVSGRVTSPASLSCSGLSPGTPPANLTITHSSIQTVVSSQTGSVTWTVTRGGQTSCSVTWSAFPSSPLNITTIQCDVQVVVNVTISVRNTPGQDKVVTCQAEGHPDTYTFQPWLQAWGGQEVRTVTGSQQRGQYSLTLTSYQDTGTYTCTVHNGVLDTSRQVIQRSASVTITVEGPPIPLSDPPSVSGEDGEPVRLYRSVYASPDLVNHTWFFDSTDVTSLIPGATTNRSRDMVFLSVHGTTVTTEGTVISLTLNMSQQYTGLYRLQACNAIGCSSATVTLMLANSSTAVPVGAIVGGILGLIALVVITLVIVFLWRRKKSRGEDGDSLQKSTKESVVQGKPNPAYVSNPDEENFHSFHPILEYNVLYDRSYNSPNQSQSTSAVGDREAKKTPNNDVYAVPKKKKKKSAEKGNTKSKTDKSSRGGRNWAQDSENSGPVRELRGGLPYSTVEVVPQPGQAARPVRSKKTMPDALYNNEPVDYANIDHTKRS